MADIINMSLETGVVPDSCFKRPHVQPMLKKPNLDSEDLKNYRPACKLAYLSKQAGRVVASRPADHMAKFDLPDPHQSAYRPCHTCETALSHVKNEILRVMDDLATLGSFGRL